MPSRYHARAFLVVSLLLAACGSRTPLEVDPPAEGPRPTPRDASPRADAAALDAEVCGGDCDDGVFCNGPEICTADGCISVGADCDDGDECTDDLCDPALDACRNVPNDADRDGDGLSGCDGDCDDTSPAVAPSLPELCDDLDNDCDGRIDEGVRSECGDCRACQIVDVPRDTGDGWEDVASSASGIDVDDAGRLRLSQTRSESSFGWIANTRFATLTKLDLRTGTQTAEYDSALLDGTNGARPPGEACVTPERGRDGEGNCPSRTAVDLRGAVYVANRAFGSQATVTKIAGRPEDCIDRNGSGRIETSRDADGDGIIERDVPGEFLGQEDECLLWSVNVGARNGVARAVAVDAEGFVWVGLHTEQRILKLDPDDGSIALNLSLTGRRNFQPYGAAVASDGNVWFVEAATGRILSIDSRTSTLGPIRIGVGRDDCRGSYGIAVDELDRVWVAGFQCRYAMRYDPVGNAFFEVPLPHTASRGIAADGEGFIYVSSSNAFLNISRFGIDLGEPIARVTRFRTDGTDLEVFGTEDDPLPGAGSVGVGLDNERRVWLVNQDSGTATRLDTRSGRTREFPVGETPYTYSDFTGFALRTFTAPDGFLRTFVEGCAMGPTEWEALRWEGSVPARSRVEVRLRTAGSVEGLDEATWVGPFPEQPADLTRAGIPGARFMEIEVTLVSEDGETSPSLESVSVQFNCPV